MRRARRRVEPSAAHGGGPAGSVKRLNWIVGRRPPALGARTLRRAWTVSPPTTRPATRHRSGSLPCRWCPRSPGGALYVHYTSGARRLLRPCCATVATTGSAPSSRSYPPTRPLGCPLLRAHAQPSAPFPTRLRAGTRLRRLRCRPLGGEHARERGRSRRCPAASERLRPLFTLPAMRQSTAPAARQPLLQRYRLRGDRWYCWRSSPSKNRFASLAEFAS